MHSFSHAFQEPSAEMRAAALFWLAEPDPLRKAERVQALWPLWEQGGLRLDPDKLLDPAQLLALSASIPGRPERPELVPPLSVKRRAMNTPEGRAILIHALAHIEFNAINLALDAVWRFPGMPADYYSDWLRVAAEEALHFSLLEAHLRSLGYEYGEFPAHNSLWDMANKTSQDVLARMALVPRTMEARGLDATPAVRAKLAQAGDLAVAEILDIILRDEIGHVAIGNRWYGWLCAQRNLDSLATYRQLARQHKAPTLRRPFNLEARRAAGFSDDELAALDESADAAVEE
ncbi:MAG: ferritin-like domain-containing protein [Burkholderiaceae bacterium]